MTLTDFVHQARRGHAGRHERRLAHRDVRRELSVYTSQTDVDDLLATFDDYDGPEVEEMRSILRAQMLRRQHRSSMPFTSGKTATPY